MKKANQDSPQIKLQDNCDALTNHAKLLRDYALTPGNIWLARSELSRISQVVTELEQLLETIKHEEAA